MTNQEAMIDVGGEWFVPDPLGGLYWPRQHILIVSDLHFEKGSSFAVRGVLLPPYDTRTTLMRLKALIKKYRPAQLISLGDAFHDDKAEHRMEEADAKKLESLLYQTKWMWILGNHDPKPPMRFAGAGAMKELVIGSLTFRHEPLIGAVSEIAGHLHPCARVSHEGRLLRRRCFITNGSRLIMPAMGAYTGGLNVLDDVYAPFFKTAAAWVMGEKGVYPIKQEMLAADRRLKKRNNAG